MHIIKRAPPLVDSASDRFQADEVRRTLQGFADLIKPLLVTANATEDMLLNWVFEAQPLVQEDLHRYVSSDPAAAGSAFMVTKAYTAFRAVAAYRLAHLILLDSVNELNLELSELARYISERAKVETGAEIHPAAQIGERFVLDHGFNTVIGETCQIGDDVTILNNVVLGAIGISGNPSGRRHPKIGSRVSIAGNTRIFGPVNVGDGSTINSGVIVAGRDIATNTRISLVAMIQVEKVIGTKSSAVKVFGIVPEGGGTFTIHGKGLLDATISLQVCSWPPVGPTWGSSLDCHAIVETATPGQSGAHLAIQCHNHSDKVIRLEISRMLPLSPFWFGLDGAEGEHCAHVILAFKDGRSIELELEDLTHFVFGRIDEATHAN